MSDKVLLVTAPDDTPIDAIRILLVDLAPEHTQLISDALNEFTSIPNIVTYIWRTGDPVDWLLDKKHKSHSIIFNADCENYMILGYMSAQSNSHYFGTLKTLHTVNNNAIYNVNDCVNLINNLIIRYE
jgi:hypothetical protein